MPLQYVSIACGALAILLGFAPFIPLQLVGVAAQLSVEPIRHQLFKLNAQQTSFGQHTAPLLDEVAEVLLPCRVGDDDRLSKESPHFGAADLPATAGFVCSIAGIVVSGITPLFALIIAIAGAAL